MERGGSVKTKTVSSSNGGGVAGKRSAREPMGHPVLPKMSKSGHGLTSQSAKKPAPISIKLGANVSISALCVSNRSVQCINC